MIVVFFVLRVILLINSSAKLGAGYDSYDLFQAFVMGWRFDTVIACYILVLPFLILFISSFFSKQKVGLRIVNVFLKIIIGVALLISVADIPYFDQFFSRFSIVALSWFDSPLFVIQMILGEPSYVFFLIAFVFLLIFILKLLNRILGSHNTEAKRKGSLGLILGSLFLGLLFVGIRGRIEKKSPIRVGTAYFSNNPFLNQLGLNPNFTFIRSFLDSRSEEDAPIFFMADQKAFEFLKTYYPVGKDKSGYSIEKKVITEGNINKYNVVLVLMESMSAKKMTRHGNKENLTPFLDSLSNQGYYFENNYSAGIHTYNGVYSTLFSFPGVFKYHPMKPVEMLSHNGIIKALKQNDYHTMYFTTHDGQFDNIEGFLKANNFDEVITQKDYPSEKVLSAMGVPDDYLFEYSVDKLNKTSARGKPFFATILTGSDHGPYHVPAFFKSPLKDVKKQIVQYADYSLRKLISLASKSKWFDNTVFIFVGDHGAVIDPVYAAPLSYNHIPLLFYAPRIINKPQVFESMSSQIDILPTLMGILNIPYTNNTLGIDLFSVKRPYSYFNADDKFGVIDQKWYLLVRDDKSLGLYQYQNGNITDFAKKYPGKVDSMKNFAESGMQAYMYLRDKKKF